MKQRAEDSEEEEDLVNQEQTDPLNDTRNSECKQKKAKIKGELVSVKLRNGDKQFYRKRIKNLMWKVDQSDRLQSATNYARKSL